MQLHCRHCSSTRMEHACDGLRLSSFVMMGGGQGAGGGLRFMVLVLRKKSKKGNEVYCSQKNNSAESLLNITIGVKKFTAACSASAAAPPPTLHLVFTVTIVHEHVYTRVCVYTHLCKLACVCIHARLHVSQRGCTSLLVVTSSERKPLGGSSVWLPQRAAAVLQVVEPRVGLVRATLLS